MVSEPLFSIYVAEGAGVAPAEEAGAQDVEETKMVKEMIRLKMRFINAGL